MDVNELPWSECYKLKGELESRMHQLRMEELHKHAADAEISDEAVAEVVGTAYRSYRYHIEDLCKIELAKRAELEHLNSIGAARMWPLVKLVDSAEATEEFAQMFPELIC